MKSKLDKPEPWDDRALAINSDGEQGRQELARACAELSLAAVATYYRDAQAAARGGYNLDQGEALDDLTSRDMPLLTNLCDPIDADVEVVGAAMIRALDGGVRWR